MLLQLQVARVTTEALGIRSFELVDPDGAPLPPFEAGAHVDVHTPSGLVRQYSLCNDPRERHHYVIGVLDDPASRGGSASMHALVRRGSRLQASTPRNHFALRPGAAKALLLAGGIGITPILSMAEQLAVNGTPFALHYCARSRERAAFRARIAAAPFAPAVRFHFDDGAAEQRLDIDALLAGRADGSDLYVCGPAGFLAHVQTAAQGAHWPAASVRVEHFGAVARAAGQDLPFSVRIASSAAVIAVEPGASVVQVLARHGIDIPVSCEQGVCGTCLTGVLAGIPEHRDCFLTPAEQARNDCFTPCCSRARGGELLLDL